LNERVVGDMVKELTIEQAFKQVYAALVEETKDKIPIGEFLAYK